MFNIKNYNSKNIKNEILSGLVVAVALVPEAIAFSFIAGVSPIVGLYTAFILGLITSLLGGKPGMISGATGAVAIVFVGLGLKVQELVASQNLSTDELSITILQYILLATLLAGAFQILVGVLKLGKFIRLVPQPAMYGFVNGLAIVIASSQFKFFDGQGWVMYSLVAFTMFMMFTLPKMTKAVPSGLVAIIVVTLIVYFTGANTILVGELTDLSAFKGMLPEFGLPTSVFTFEAVKIVAPYAFLVAMVGIIESLLTLSVLDEMSSERGSGNKECIAQGVGNITCGSFGAMAGCAMIGQSIINYTSGGLGRISSFIAAVGLMVLVAVFTDLLNIIPVAVLVGIMFMVSIGTFEWSSYSHLKSMPKSDAFVMVAVTLITVVADLAIAVISGVIISALVFAWKHANVYGRSTVLEDGTKLYELDGPLFFASAPTFADNFDVENDPKNVIIDFHSTRVMDASGAEAIDALIEKYEKVKIDVSLRHLSEDCKAILKHAKSHCEYAPDDPNYRVARDY
ncbi:MAG: SulP family inorganic anion transporter [Campylobacterota bacterium]|nr:SulP family inorganic anion transporter [Campylobacterota bacterium]